MAVVTGESVGALGATQATVEWSDICPRLSTQQGGWRTVISPPSLCSRISPRAEVIILGMHFVHPGAVTAESALAGNSAPGYRDSALWISARSQAADALGINSITASPRQRDDADAELKESH